MICRKSKLTGFGMIGTLVVLTLHDGGLYDIETSSLICSANQWTGVYMIETSVMKELEG